MVELVCSDEVISPLLGHPRYLTIRRVVINSQTPQTPLSWLKINIDLLCSDSSGSEWRTKVSCLTLLSNTRGGAPCLALYWLCLARISFMRIVGFHGGEGPIIGSSRNEKIRKNGSI